MFQNEFHYELVLWTDDPSRTFGPLPIRPDFAPAVEAVRFEAVRSAADTGNDVAVVIEPIFAHRIGEQRIRGIRAILRRRAADDAAVIRMLEFPLEYFGALAREAAAGFVERGGLERGEPYFYGVRALRLEAAAGHADAPPRRGSLVIQQVEPPLALKTCGLRALVQRSLLIGDVAEDESPLIVHREVLRQAAVLARAGGACEVGAVLAGHVCRDPAVPEAFVEVTALVAIPSPKPELTRFRFTPDAWDLARREIRQRGRGEEMVGWLHSHRFGYEMCKDCSRTAMKSCTAALPFLSTEDCHLHRLVFPRAYSVALLVNDAPCAGMSITAFGWRDGRIARRAYHVLDASQGSFESASAAVSHVQEGQS